MFLEVTILVAAVDCITKSYRFIVYITLLALSVIFVNHHIDLKLMFFFYYLLIMRARITLFLDLLY